MGQSRAYNRSSAKSSIGLVLSAIYLNLTFDAANGSEHHSYGGGYGVPYGHSPGYWGTYGRGGGGGGYYGDGGGGYIPILPPTLIPELLTRLAIGGYGGYQDGGAGGGFYNRGANNGFANNQGYYDDLFAQRHALDVGRGQGNAYDYGRGSVVGGGYRDLGGRNKGHTASGFSNSYRKDESGDRSSYYDDGLGHRGKINYGAHDDRFRAQGGHLGRGGFHNTNLKRYGTGATGQFADGLSYSRGGDRGAHYSGGGYGYRHGRLVDPKKSPNNNKTGLYVVPMPATLFFDVTPPPV